MNHKNLLEFGRAAYLNISAIAGFSLKTFKKRYSSRQHGFQLNASEGEIMLLAVINDPIIVNYYPKNDVN